MTLYFWDASDFDWPRGPMDLAAARADGIVGFTHKATEGTSVRHVHTGEALARARAAGLEFIGAYHVVRTGNVAGQVAYFLAYLDQVASWWRSFPGFFLQVDLELWSYDRVSAATGAAFTAQLAAAQPKRVILYASRGQYGDQLAGIAAPLWNAAYGSNPVAHYPDAYPGDGSANWRPYSGQTPAFWQFGSQLRIGTQPGADCNAFRGSIADLRALIEGEDMTTADDMWAFAENGERPIKPDSYTPPGYDSMPNNWMGTMLGKAQQDAARAYAAAQAVEAKCDQILAALAALQPASGLTPAELGQVEAAAETGAKAGIDGATATIHAAP